MRFLQAVCRTLNGQNQQGNGERGAAGPGAGGWRIPPAKIVKLGGFSFQNC